MILLTDEQKTKSLRIGIGLAGVLVDNRTAELIWRTYEGIIQKQGKFSVDDQAEIEALVITRYDLGKRKKLKKKEKQEV